MTVLARIKMLARRVMGPTLDEAPDLEQAAVVVFAAAYETGPNIARWAQFTRQPKNAIAEMSRRMRKYRVWRAGRVAATYIGAKGANQWKVHTLWAAGWLTPDHISLSGDIERPGNKT